ncbi:single-stranded DNA-binding protein [Glutamicibacter arilaitensis]|uniref:Single-stranded DNA-binding protein n=1 Tax=Glutamicibacter arilaitensis TaxID=256701 RepID=A0A4Y8TXS7_9MICC|nr:single-stranded DNA-binding protein [Glutamicibacter arilaitensis]TFH56980.1 single-stranded DNA-binding protein [Glutamicibacter arilaitensis]
MSDLVTIRGIVGTEPQLSITPKGVAILKFRVATHERKRDLETGQWVDGPTNWYAVSAFRTLGENSMESLAQGDHVMIFGKLQIREFERADGSRGNSADIEAFSIGHDMRFGTSSFNRIRVDASESDHVQQPSRLSGTEASWQSDEGEAA